MRKTLFILTILTIPLTLTFLFGCGPSAQEKSNREALAKYPSLTEWKNMRARLVPEGTEVYWRLYVAHVHSSYEFIGRLEGYWDWEVTCWTRLASVSSPAVGDWVRVTGRFLKVDEQGRVKIAVEELTNLGPGY